MEDLFCCCVNKQRLTILILPFILCNLFRKKKLVSIIGDKLAERARHIYMDIAFISVC